MDETGSVPPRGNLFALAMAAWAGGVFVFDVLTDAQIAAGVLYVPVILMASRLRRRRSVARVCMGCIVLTVLGHALSPGDRWATAAIINTGLSLIALAATALLVTQNPASHRDSQRR